MGSGRSDDDSNIKTILSVLVQDNGVGIEESDVPKLFEPFVTLENG